MHKELLLESVRERDIDLLFLEEWNTNDNFVGWFLKEALGYAVDVEYAVGYHSISSDNLGETDLFLEYKCNDNPYCLLVENKIDALAQKNQGSRYNKRAEILKNSKYKDVKTCIIAPNHYLELNTEVKEYEISVSYEKIESWFNEIKKRRELYRANIIRLAIDQERRGYISEVDPVVTKFWHDYWEIITAELPNAFMKEPYSVAKGSDWPVVSYEWLPKGWILRHKLEEGSLDLQTTLDEKQINETAAKINDKKMTIKKTGKSFSISLSVKPMNRLLPLFDQIDKMKIALSACREMDKIKEVIG